ncbi:MAG: hypothetical protein ACERLB_08530 [Gammaproteobacteria bacterium]
MSDTVPSSSVAWAKLQDELDLWSDTGNSATFWWRDDDATRETAELKRLNSLSQDLQIPVALATIPSLLHNSLPRYLRERNNFTVFQHGYSHSSYAAEGMKRIEVGGERSTDEIQTQLATGCQKLQDAFADQFLPVLVPPWNRIEPRTYAALVSAGFCGVSSMWARASAYPAEGLLQVNTHLDPVNWRHDRGFIGESRAIAHICNHLFTRRANSQVSSEPTGILTHQLAQTEEVWDFVRRLMQKLSEHPAVEWLDARSIWANEITR